MKRKQKRGSQPGPKPIVILLCVFVVILSAVGAYIMVKKSKWLTFEITTLSQSQRNEVATAANDWRNRYGSRDVRIIAYNNPDVETTKSGATITTLAVGGPGYIAIDPTQEGSLRNTSLHEMTHAQRPDNGLKLTDPILFSDGWILGYHGLAIIVRLKDGTETMFQLFEEGMAERNASYFKGYTVSNGSYFAIGNLTRQYFPVKYDGVRLISENDVPGFVAVVLGISREQVAAPQIERVMAEYQLAFNSGAE